MGNSSSMGVGAVHFRQLKGESITMDIGKSLTFFTEEERWIEKTAIGVGVILISSILSAILIGVVGFFIVLGYCVRLMQNVQNGVKPVLPEWNQWGDDLSRGFKLFVIQLVWALPIIVVSIPLGVGSALLENSRGGGEFFGLLIVLCSACLMAAYGIFVALIQPGFTIAFSYNERISAGLQLSPIWRWTRKNLGNVAIIVVVYLLASIGLGLAGSIVGLLLCFVGLIVTVPLAQLLIYFIQYHLYGQLDPGELAPARHGYSPTGFASAADPWATPAPSTDAPEQKAEEFWGDIKAAESTPAEEFAAEVSDEPVADASGTDASVTDEPTQDDTGAVDGDTGSEDETPRSA
jgi:hypothetical protein